MRLLVAVVVLAVCAGCYATRTRDGSDGSVGPDGSLGPDASQPVDAAWTDAPRELDASVSRDAGADAAACTTVDERSVRACVLTPTGTIPEGERFELPVTRSRCLCPTRACDVTVRADRIELALRTCELGVDCDECTHEASCLLPPMERGARALWVDGVLAGPVAVAPPEMVREARPTCLAVPDAPNEALVCGGAVVERSGSAELCHRTLEDVGSHVRFTWTASCAGCFDWSAGCEAQREDARTIVIRPRIQACECPTCGVCESGCFAREVTCETPPLRAGRYDVVLERPSGERVTASVLEVRDVDVPGPVRCTATS